MSSSKRKKERRRMRYERNVRKEKEYKAAAWEAGKLIEPNHNGGPYPGEYCIELGQRLQDKFKYYHQRIAEEPELGNEWFIQKFRLYRMKIRDFILHYSPDIQKTPEYEYLKGLIETYWDTPENLLEWSNNNLKI